jgi:hypothetical protein
MPWSSLVMSIARLTISTTATTRERLNALQTIDSSTPVAPVKAEPRASADAALNWYVVTLP